MSATRLVLGFSLVLVLSAHSTAFPQGIGNYLNFESPQVKPVTTAVVGTSADLGAGDAYLLVCNTPNNRVEVYDITNPDAPTLEASGRIPVGLEPVSVAFRRFTNANGTRRNMMYTANWLGDSVTIVELFSTSGTLNYKMIGTFPISAPRILTTDPVQGDEAMNVACVEIDTRDMIVVTKRSRSSIAFLNAFSGAPVDPATGTANNSFLDIILVGRFAAGAATSFPSDAPVAAFPNVMAMKEPHVVAVSPTEPDKFVVLAHKGGGSKFHVLEDGVPAGEPPPPNWQPGFDFDLWSADIDDIDNVPTTTRIPTAAGQPAFGTTNFNLAFDAAAALYVVGLDAQNATVGNSALAGMSTGFTRSMLYRLKSGSVVELDLNAGAGATGTAIAEPTDVAVFDPAGADLFVVVVGFSSDSIARIQVEDSTGVLAPASWTVLTATVPHLATDNAPPRMPEMAGPRGLAVDSSTGRAYVLASVDNSLATYDVSTGAPVLKDQRALAFDPRPPTVKLGKKFLYSTQGSGRPGAPPGTPGFVSCSSCHIDSRADHLAWRLTPEHDIDMPNDASEGPNDFKGVSAAGDVLGPQFGFGFDADFDPTTFLPTNASTFFAFMGRMTGSAGSFPPPESPDIGGFPDSGGLEEPPGTFANAKGVMVTQSLQGLANFEVKADGLLVHRFTNAPYHWRGDKPTFLTFNEAFVGLQGRSAELDSADMEQYEDFINSIHYPPNNAQLLSRVYSGDPGPTPPKSGAQLGLDLFHTRPLAILGARSCSSCHEDPVSTDNLWTTGERSNDPSPIDLNTQPLNTAALRGMVHKERNLELNGNVPGMVGTLLNTGNFGFGHDGQRGRTTNSFVDGVGELDDVTEATPIVTFLREFDSAVAPIVGRTVTIMPTDIDSSGNFLPAAAAKQTMVQLMEAQALEANSALVAQWFDDDGGLDGNPNNTELKRGYWFEIGRSGGARYKRENNTSALTRAQLLDQMNELGGNGDRVVFTAVPEGSERRIASMTGAPTAPGASSATALTVHGSTPNTANAPLVGLTGNAFVNWNESGVGHGEIFLKPINLFVYEQFRTELLNQGVVTVAAEHDAPRRLQFTGAGLEEGGVLRLGISTSTVAPQSTDTFEFIDLPIFPTNQFAGGGTSETDRIWETFVELDSRFFYMLLLGGPRHPGVQNVLAGNAPAPGDFTGGNSPTVWNKYKLIYVSPSASTFEHPWPAVLKLNP
jgi:DNA-binding beta-propeller fold protein YncE